MIPENRKQITVISIAVILFIGIVVLWFVFMRPVEYKGVDGRYSEIMNGVGQQLDKPVNLFQENTKKLFESEEYKLLEKEIEQALATSTATSTIEEQPQL